MFTLCHKTRAYVLFTKALLILCVGILGYSCADPASSNSEFLNQDDMSSSTIVNVKQVDAAVSILLDLALEGTFDAESPSFDSTLPSERDQGLSDSNQESMDQGSGSEPTNLDQDVPSLPCNDENPCTYNDRYTERGECVGTPIVCESTVQCIELQCNGTSTCVEEALTNQFCDQGQVRSECEDMLDNDEDGLIDEDDPFCLFENHPFEAPQCDFYSDPIDIVSASQTLVIESPLTPSFRRGTCGSGRGSEVPIALVIEETSTLKIYTTPTPNQNEFDTLLYLRGQNCNSSDSEIRCNNDGGPGDYSTLHLPELAPGLYYLFVDNEDEYDLDDLIDEDEVISPFESTTLHIEISPFVEPNCNDRIDNDQDQLIDSEDLMCTFSNGQYESPTCTFVLDPIDLVRDTQTISVSNQNSSGNYRGSCGGNGNETVIALLVETPSSLRAYTTANEQDPFDSILYLREGLCDQASQEIACNDQSLSDFTEIQLPTLFPGLYYLFVDDRRRGFLEKGIDVHIEITPLANSECSDGQDNDQDNLVDQDDPFCIGDHWFESPYCQHYSSPIEVVSSSQILEISFENSGLHYSGSCGGDGKEVPIAVLLNEPTTLKVETTYNNFNLDTVIYLFADVCDSNRDNLICNDDGGDQYFSLFQTAELPAGLYYLFIDQYEERGSGVRSVNVAIEFGSDPLLPPAGEPLNECEDTFDNDLDGWIDYPEDIQCSAPSDLTEADPCRWDESIHLDLQGNSTSIPLVLEEESQSFPLYCGGSINQQIYSFDLSQATNLSVLIQSPAGLNLPSSLQYALELHTQCDSTNPHHACVVFSPNTAHEYTNLAPGRYYLILQQHSGNHIQNLLLNLRATPIATECSDGVDNDLDGLIDLYDESCLTYQSSSEDTDSPVETECSDQVDNDEDQLLDYPQDPGCISAGDPIEGGRCDFGSRTSADYMIPSGDVLLDLDLQEIERSNPPILNDLTCTAFDETVTYSESASLALITFEINEPKMMYVWVEGPAFLSSYGYIFSPICQFDASAMCDEVPATSDSLDLDTVFSAFDMDDLSPLFLLPGIHSLYLHRINTFPNNISPILIDKFKVLFSSDFEL